MTTPTKNKITKEKFQKYVNVQKSGKYNMYDPMAQKMTGLNKEDYFEIIENYLTYQTKYKIFAR
jgi:hypothetical protein